MENRPLSLDALIPGNDYYIQGPSYRAAGIYVRSEVVGQNVGRGDKLFTRLYFRDIINVKDETPHRLMAGKIQVPLLAINTKVYEKINPRLELMDSHNMERMTENFWRFHGPTGVAAAISSNPGGKKWERFQKPIPNQKEVKERLLELDFNPGPWLNAEWDREEKIYVIPQKGSSEKEGSSEKKGSSKKAKGSSEKKGGFSRKNKKGKKRKGISLKNRISKVRG